MKKATACCMGILLGTVLLPSGTAVQASDTGAFVGGMLASSVLRNMSERTKAEQVQAYNSARPAQPASAPAESSSPQEKLDQLDNLAANGYISKEEYQARRKAILDSM